MTLQVDGRSLTFYVGLVAVKGDWPFVRKAYKISAGFRSSRICHLCPSQAPLIKYSMYNICGIYKPILCGRV